MPMMDEAGAWAEELDRLMGLVGPRFGRVEVRRRAMAYVRGLWPRGAQEWLAAGGSGGRSDAGRDAGLPLPDALGCGSGPG